MRRCGGLTLAGCQVPTKSLYHSLLLNWTGRQKCNKGSWVDIRTGGSLNHYRHGKNKMAFLAVAWFTGYVSSQVVVASTTVCGTCPGVFMQWSNIVNLPDFSVLKTQSPPYIPRRFSSCVLLDCNTFHIHE